MPDGTIVFALAGRVLWPQPRLAGQRVITFVPVIDLSRNQGAVDFVKLKSTGAQGLILRVGHGQTVDDHFESYWHAAVAAGFRPDDICVYTFINPKRGTGAQCAVAMIDEIRRVVGHTDVGYMLDVENYRDQSPNIGQAPVYGPSFAAWLREHISTVHLEAPGARIFGYCNLAYWNGPIAPGSSQVWVGDDELAGELDWLAARYPAYSDAAYAHYGYPGTPDTWADWAFKAQPQGPLPPRGGSWVGWQPSAGWNRQGATYGVSSRDLDIDIVHPAAWARWTGKTSPIPQPQPEDDMAYIVTNADPQTGAEGPGVGAAAPRENKFRVLEDGRVKPQSLTDLKALGLVDSLDLGVPLTNDELAGKGYWTPLVVPPAQIAPGTPITLTWTEPGAVITGQGAVG